MICECRELDGTGFSVIGEVGTVEFTTRPSLDDPGCVCCAGLDGDDMASCGICGIVAASVGAPYAICAVVGTPDALSTFINVRT